MSNRGKPALDVFMESISLEANGCWNWLGYLNTKGYGQFKKDGARYYSHRWSYEYFVGAIPDGLMLDHLCRNPACVNPRRRSGMTDDLQRGRAGFAERRSVGQLYRRANLTSL